MDFELNVRMTRAVWKAGALRLYERFFWRYTAMVGGLFLAGFVLFPRLAGRLGVAMWVLLVAVAAAWTLLGRRAAIRSICQRAVAVPEGEVAFRVTDEGLVVPAPGGEFLYPWKRFRLVRQYPEVSLLYYDKQQALSLPPDVLRGDAGQIILRRIREAGGRIKQEMPDRPEPRA
jgi:hypothetical protein